MGELLFCNESIAAMPYYIDSISINLYSIEELCYYIMNNTYLIERDFMCEELCTWIDKEVKNHSLAENLRDLLHKEGLLSEFVLAIMKESGYCTKDEVLQILGVIQEMEDKSEFECNKIRADRLLEKGKYLTAIYEYRRLLDQDDIQSENAILYGLIWHNLGTAYARLFLFEEAAKCYEVAYSFNEKTESLRELLMTYRCMRDEAGFLETANKYHLDEMFLQEIRNEISIASRSDVTQVFENQLEEIAGLNAYGKREEYQKRINDIIQNWKEEYRSSNIG